MTIVRVAFRTDASVDIGNGHAMRCLTLADALRARGADCVFICRLHEGHLIDKIRQQGFEVAALPRAEAGNSCATEYAGWLGTNQADDARQTMAALPGRIDWMVVDHYALDALWESLLRPACDRLLVIDDLANRSHDADLLIDQNAGREALDYAGLVPAACQVLAGPRYALLRPEFEAGRAAGLQQRKGPVRELLVCMGGVDKDDASSAVLDRLSACPLPDTVRISVVLGPHAPHAGRVRQRAAGMPWPTRVLADVADMAGLMMQSDLAIGAAGGSALERCCVGLPSILIPVAANQQAGAAALARLGGTRVASLDAASGPSVAEAIASLLAEGELEKASAACASITNGSGARTIAAMMTDGLPPRLRPMELYDLNKVLAWRNSPQVRQWMIDSQEITPDSHAAWFQRTRATANRELLIAEAEGNAIGFVQFSRLQDDGCAEWGFYTAPGAPKGSGTILGKLALEYAFRTLDLHRLVGRTLPHNFASIRFHEKFSFRRQSAQATGDSPVPLLSFELDRATWETTCGVIA